ncbi:MAG: DUF1015 domain-containing protein [Deltaproteobacteria bacterium]|nr:DUF1015 domain-containing protein [Deltaproteobacteria bacterium]
MAVIIPFRGVLYNTAKVGKISSVIAPPYDVISSKYQDELYARHPNNFVRIELNKTAPEDKEGSDRHSRSAELLNKWIAEGVLKRDDKPAIYYYTQTYKLKDVTTQVRKGFIALAKLEDLGKGIHPHEKTLSGPKADRLKLMQATDSNMSCIFSLYSEPKLTINSLIETSLKGAAPSIDVRDDEGVENRFWRVVDADVISKVAMAMDNKALFIADGHHRYETALNYRNMMRESSIKGGITPKHTGAEPYNFVMMYFSNMDDQGMTIWPTHRVVHGLQGFTAAGFLGKCREHFNVREFKFSDSGEYGSVRNEFLSNLEASGKGKISIGLSIRGAGSYYVLILKAKDTMQKVFGNTIPDVFKNLDVTVLHSLILGRALGISQEAQEKQQNLLYVTRCDDALDAVNKDNNQLVFLLNPTRVEQVKAAAEAGFVMPQKSTYFYPKLLSGLVINLLDGKQPKQVMDTSKV